MGTVVILTALQVEYAAVRAFLVDRIQRSHPTGTLFEVGKIAGVPQHEVAIAVVGEGREKAAVGTATASGLFNPQALLFVGVAGSLKDDIDVGDVVVATHTYAYQGGKESQAGFAARPKTWEAPNALLQLARHVELDGTWGRHLAVTLDGRPPNVFFKPVAAGDVVLDSRTSYTANQLQQHYNDAAAIENEGAGAAAAGHLANLPVLTIRGISDKADGLKHAADAGGSQPRAAEHAAAFAAALVAAIPADPAAGRSDHLPDVPLSATTFTQLVQPTPGGGPVYVVQNGNQHVHPAEHPVHHQAAGVAAAGTATAADIPTGGALPWTVLGEPPTVTWRTGMIPDAGYSAIVEVHLLPAKPGPRLEYRRLEQLPERLVGLGRETRVFGAGQGVDHEVRGEVACAWTNDPRKGTSGLACHRTGQRSVWLPLPKDSLGAVLDPDELPLRIERLLTLLLRIDGPALDPVVPVIAVEPAESVSFGSMKDMPRRSANIRMTQGPLRVPADEALPAGSLAAHTGDVAQELSARLEHALRTSR
ncbi:5'-methylthioadenosine/S-adenosylhomocysteine nucleosidase family protein [Streptomyces sp. SID1121]|uniref:5'-methylthioadenosine/S-adenosylhomocysteine nucleosidase family protein n=1 Tax=Streptomyces sp. SID1121 TaxID=3425888 RepID=UPI004056BF90